MAAEPESAGPLSPAPPENEAASPVKLEEPAASRDSSKAPASLPGPVAPEASPRVPAASPPASPPAPGPAAQATSPPSPVPFPAVLEASPLAPSPAGSRPGPETFRQRFRQFRYHEAAGPREAFHQLRELSRQWLRPEVRTKEQIVEMLVQEQLMAILPEELRARRRGRRSDVRITG
ncbi:SCAN domain-containing protein 1 [Monodelphis domestica]|uniref:SCAN domain-containing protein 1 n=1 Tax=Monodelphis domestica TaxID=13616 RepID=F7F4G7_MONDO|nr:SCAN domain-containing protein 1 [Monodelphis domestica]